MIAMHRLKILDAAPKCGSFVRKARSPKLPFEELFPPLDIATGCIRPT